MMETLKREAEFCRGCLLYYLLRFEYIPVWANCNHQGKASEAKGEKNG